jgi:hypothetical protein
VLGHRNPGAPNRRHPGLKGPLGDILIAPRPGGSVALCLRKGVYLDLDRSATEIVELVRRYGVDRAVTKLAERHGMSCEVSSRHVEKVLTTFALVEASPATRGRALTAAGFRQVLRQWLGFPTRLKVGTAYTTGLVMMVEALLRLRPLDQTARWLGSPLVTRDPGQLPCFDPNLLTDRELRLLSSLRWVQRLWPWDATCLRRALAAGWLLRRRKPGLCLGLPGSEDVLAHAWLIVGGQALDGLPGTVPLLPPEVVRLDRG